MCSFLLRRNLLVREAREERRDLCEQQAVVDVRILQGALCGIPTKRTSSGS